MASWYNPPVQFVPWERDTGAALFRGGNMAKIVASRFRSPSRPKEIPVIVEVSGEQELPLEQPARPLPPQETERKSARGAAGGSRLPPPPPLMSPGAKEQSLLQWREKLKARGADGDTPRAPPAEEQCLLQWREKLKTCWAADSDTPGATNIVEDLPKKYGTHGAFRPAHHATLAGEEDWGNAVTALSPMVLQSLQTVQVRGRLSGQRGERSVLCSPSVPEMPGMVSQPEDFSEFAVSLGLEHLRAGVDMNFDGVSLGLEHLTAGVDLNLDGGPQKSWVQEAEQLVDRAGSQRSWVQEAEQLLDRNGTSSAWMSALAACSPTAFLALPTMLVIKATAGAAPCTKGAGGRKPSVEDVKPLGEAEDGAGAALQRRPPCHSWEYPLTRREKLDRVVLVAGREVEVSELRAEGGVGRARRSCAEAAELRAENLRLKDLVEELEVRLAVSQTAHRRGPRASRYGGGYPQRVALRKRVADCLQQRLRRLGKDAGEAAVAQAKLQWAQEQLEAVQQENQWLRAQRAAGLSAPGCVGPAARTAAPGAWSSGQGGHGGHAEAPASPGEERFSTALQHGGHPVPPAPPEALEVAQPAMHKLVCHLQA